MFGFLIAASMALAGDGSAIAHYDSPSQAAEQCAEGSVKACFDSGYIELASGAEGSLERAMDRFDAGCEAGLPSACALSAAVYRETTPQPEWDERAELSAACSQIDVLECGILTDRIDSLAEMGLSPIDLARVVQEAHRWVEVELGVSFDQAHPVVYAPSSALELLWFGHPSRGVMALYDLEGRQIVLYPDSLRSMLAQTDTDPSLGAPILGCVLVHELVHAAQRDLIEPTLEEYATDSAYPLVWEGHASLIQERVCPAFGSPEAHAWLQRFMVPHSATDDPDAPAVKYGKAREFVRQYECMYGRTALRQLLITPGTHADQIRSGSLAEGPPAWCESDALDIQDAFFGRYAVCDLDETNDVLTCFNHTWRVTAAHRPLGCGSPERGRMWQALKPRGALVDRQVRVKRRRIDLRARRDQVCLSARFEPGEQVLWGRIETFSDMLLERLKYRPEVGDWWVEPTSDSTY